MNEDRIKSALMRTVSQLQDGLVAYINRNETYCFVNKAFGQWFGKSTDEILGKQMSDLVDEEFYQQQKQYINQVFAGKQVSFEGDYSKVGGGHRHLLMTFVPDEDTEGSVQGFLLHAIDYQSCKDKEKRLEESEERFRQLADNLKGQVLHIFELNKPHVSYVSPSYEEVWGRTTKSLREDPFSFIDAIHPDDRWIIENGFDGQSRGNYEEMFYRIIRPDGEIRYIHDTASPIFDENGEVIRVTGIAHDITSMKQLEIAHQELISTLETMLETFLSFDLNYRLTYANAEAEKFLGRKREELVGKTAAELFPSDDRLNFETRFRRVFESGHPVYFEDTYDDRYFQVHAYRSLYGGISIFFRDVTEQKLLQKAVDRERLRMYDLFMRVPASIAIVRGPEFVFEYANLKYLEMVGKNHDSLIGLRLQDAFPDPSQDVVSLLRDVFLTGERFLAQEYPITHGESIKKYKSFVFEPLKDSDDAVEAIMIFAFDVTDLVLARKAIEESEQKIRNYAEAMPQMAFIADPQGNILYYNRRWYDYIGQLEGTTGWGWIDQKIHHPDDLEETVKRWTESLKTGDPYQIEYRLRRFDGQYRWFLGRAIAERDQNQKIIRWYGTNTDIHNQKIAEEELKHAKEEAERANQLKSAFLANMSHEIRTPIGVMIGFADLIIQPDTTVEDRKDYVHTIKRSGSQLTALIDDILDLSKVEAGYLQVESVEIVIGELIKQVFSELSLKAIEKGLKIQYEIKDHVITYIYSDPLRLKQIIWNLIGNAIKFTKEGGVKLVVDQIEEKLFFHFEDTGIGIPSEAQQHIFDPFSQVDGSFSRQYGGVGLGLALSKRLAKILGGDLKLVSSIVRKGSIFVLSIPIAIEHEISHRPENFWDSMRNHDQTFLQGMKILVIEDSPENQEFIRIIMKKRGATVDLAENGKIGFQKAINGHYHLILMDIQMPDDDGYTITKKLRSHGLQTPIIAVTAHAMRESRMESLDAGCNEYLTKPIDIGKLLGLARKYRVPSESQRSEDRCH